MRQLLNIQIQNAAKLNIYFHALHPSDSRSNHKTKPWYKYEATFSHGAKPIAKVQVVARQNNRKSTTKMTLFFNLELKNILHHLLSCQVHKHDLLSVTIFKELCNLNILTNKNVLLS